MTTKIAIVGMSGRFPGAEDIEAFWENLRAGVSGITFLTPEELAEAGVAAAEIADPRYVPAAGRLSGADLFDAPLFGLNPREAEVMDPQQRVFLECAWAALEDAGYDPGRFPGWIGVYAGSGIGKYLWMNVARSPEALAAVGTFQAMISNDKDYLPSQVSYRLNLRGPSVGVQTACSTSLVAVHLACQALLCFECDLALAGGVALSLPADWGYLYQEDGLSSPDGCCRPFDARAGGTIRGNGVGVVVLKRLADAEADGDRVLAVIKGSAINNDGSGKVGYTAPSVTGQAEVIAAALAAAGVAPETIDYVEAHGTATRLGDPVEVAALTQAFALEGRPGSCALGSVKSNVGHLDAAAGVTGLIKTALALHHGELPPTLHFESPNPQIDFGSGPFYVSAERRPWPAGQRPRRAGVSAFGIGGTNAHMILEEAPSPAAAPVEPFRWHLLPLSAGSETALAEMTARLARHLREHPEIALADAAYTLQVGRRELARRLAIVARSPAEAAERLEEAAAARPMGEAAEERSEAGAEELLSQATAAEPETAEPLLARLGRLWARGAAIDWQSLHEGERRRRVPLPTYPFERRRYWIEGGGEGEPASAPVAGRRPFSEWFYLPSWRRTLPPRHGADPLSAVDGARCCLILADDEGLGEALGAALRERGWEVVLAFAGEAWETISPGRHRMRPGDASDHARLWQELAAGPGLPRRVLHLWNVTAAPPGAPEDELEDLATGLDRGFYSLLHLARAFGRHPGASMDFVVFSNRLHAIDGGDRPEPVKAALLGICRVLPQEQGHVRCKSVDLVLQSPRLREQCLAEIEGMTEEDGEGTVAWRGPHRWTSGWEEVSLGEDLAGLRRDGIYLVTGGLGGVGLEVAELLAQSGARLVLVGRRPFPERESWDGWIESHGEEDPVSRKIRRLRAFEGLGAEVLTVAADVSDLAQMEAVAEKIRQRFGARFDGIDGIFHAAGVAGGGLLAARAPEQAAAVLAPKVRGTLVLARVFADVPLLVLFSSLNSLLGGIGQADYAAANAFLDGFATARAARGGRRTVAINWDAWREVGMAAQAEVPEELRAWRDEQLDSAIRPDEGRAALACILAAGAVQIALATDSLARRLAEAATLRLSTALLASAAAPRRAEHPRPAVAPAYAAPETPLETRLAGLWRELLGISPIGRDDGFFELGGHSLLAGQLSARLRDEIGIELPLEAIFAYPTPALLAAALSELEAEAPVAPAPSAVPIPPLPREDACVFPLSYAQERLWYLEQLTPGLAAYNVPLAVRLTGRLDRAALAAALQAVVSRHEALRTGFRTEEGRPVQVIAPDVTVQLPGVDLRDLAPDEREREVARLAAEEAGGAFDLQRGPLLRARLLALGGAEHVLLLTLHHIVSDRWSMGVLMGELAALYSGEPLPALPLQYADYAVWQREWLQGEVLATQLAYWRERLADLPALDLPVDRRRPARPGHRGGQVAMELPDDLAAALRDFCREGGVTLFMALLAAFLVVLARVGGQDDVAVGTAVANRGRREIEGLIGFFVNTLVLRVSLAGEPSFRELLARVCEVTLGAYDHQDLPFERLVEELHPARDGGRAPLVQVTFLLQNTPLPDLRLPGLALAEVPIELATAKFDLSVAMTEQVGGLTGIWSYDAEIFTAATIERLVGFYRRLLAAALADPGASVFALPLAAEDEMASLLSDFTRCLT